MDVRAILDAASDAMTGLPPEQQNEPDDCAQVAVLAALRALLAQGPSAAMVEAALTAMRRSHHQALSDFSDEDALSLIRAAIGGSVVQLIAEVEAA